MHGCYNINARILKNYGSMEGLCVYIMLYIINYQSNRYLSSKRFPFYLKKLEVKSIFIHDIRTG